MISKKFFANFLLLGISISNSLIELGKRSSSTYSPVLKLQVAWIKFDMKTIKKKIDNFAKLKIFNLSGKAYRSFSWIFINTTRYRF